MARRHADNHSGRQMVNPVTGASYTVASPDGVYTFTASARVARSFKRTTTTRRSNPSASLSTRDAAVGEHPKFPPSRSIHHGRTSRDQHYAARPHHLKKDQANTLQDYFRRELQVLGSQALSSNLPPAGQIAQLTALQRLPM
jgi:hypothetical protein